MFKLFAVIGAVVVAALAFAGAIALAGLIWMTLWNLLVPSIFHGPRISVVQGIGLSFVIALIGGAFSRSR